MTFACRHSRFGIVHLELHTDDSDDAVEFLSGLLGWPTESVRSRSADSTYLSLGVGGRVGGGIVECGQSPAQWVPYVVVERIEPMTRRAEELGADVVMGQRGTAVGRRCVVSTPATGLIVLWEPKRR